MSFKKIILSILSVAGLLFAVTISEVAAQDKNAVQTTAAFAEVYTQKVEAEIDLKILLFDFTETSSQVIAKTQERDLLDRQLRWLEALPSGSHRKLTLTLGKMLVRKALAEAGVKNLSKSVAEEHQSMKKAKTRLEMYNSEIQKLLQ